MNDSFDILSIIVSVVSLLFSLFTLIYLIREMKYDEEPVAIVNLEYKEFNHSDSHKIVQISISLRNGGKKGFEIENALLIIEYSQSFEKISEMINISDVDFLSHLNNLLTESHSHDYLDSLSINSNMKLSPEISEEEYSRQMDLIWVLESSKTFQVERLDECLIENGYYIANNENYVVERCFSLPKTGYYRVLLILKENNAENSIYKSVKHIIF